MLTINTNNELIEVADNDCLGVYDYFEALDICKIKGINWRLPSEYELECMFFQLYKNDKGNFTFDGFYWTSSSNAEKAKVKCFNEKIHLNFVALIEEDCFVRLVRNITIG